MDSVFPVCQYSTGRQRWCVCRQQTGNSSIVPTSRMELNGYGDGLGSSLAGCRRLIAHACVVRCLLSVAVCFCAVCSFHWNGTNKWRYVDINANRVYSFGLCSNRVVRCALCVVWLHVCALRVQKYDSHIGPASMCLCIMHIWYLCTYYSTRWNFKYWDSG